MKSECKYSFLEAKSRLEHLCAYQERCSSELEKKLYDWGLDQEDASRLIAHLISNNYLSEERFAEAFVSGKVSIKRWGRIKIKQQLKQKRISDYSIKKAIESIDYDLYLANVKALIEKKWGSLKKEKMSYQKKVKVYRFLSSKGYETELIKEMVEDYLQRD